MEEEEKESGTGYHTCFSAAQPLQKGTFPRKRKCEKTRTHEEAKLPLVAAARHFPNTAGRKVEFFRRKLKVEREKADKQTR